MKHPGVRRAKDANDLMCSMSECLLLPITERSDITLNSVTQQTCIQANHLI